MPFLEVNQLCKSFGGLMAVNHLDFSMDEGEIVGLIGPNGSGKTTTLNLLTGFLKPDSGSVKFKDRDITGLSRSQLSHAGIGRTFQLIKPFLEFTALENVMVGRLYGHVPSKNMAAAREEALAILAQVGLEKKAEVKVRSLALMERKKLELARALATRPQLLLIDELMAGLNPGEVDDACRLIDDIRKSQITIIMVEHIVKAICGLSDRIMVLNMGEKIAEDVPDAIIHNPQVIEVYLGKAHACH